MTMTIRGALVGADTVLDGLPKQAFTVRSWQDNVAVASQRKTREALKSGYVIEPVWDSANKRYVGLVWSTWAERNYCRIELLSRQESL